MIAGLPDGGTPVSSTGRFVAMEPAFDPDQGATCRAPSPTAVLRIVGFCALTDRFSPAGEARHIAFLSAVIYG